jgi:choline kinase
MQAIILAAGVGERLGDAARGLPKSLLDMDGLSLLARHCRVLRGLGVDAIHVVTGFRAELVDAELDAQPDGRSIGRIHNTEYRRGSVLSLRAAGAVLRAGTPVLVMDADVLCDPGILRALTSTRAENCFLLDRHYEPGDEPVKLCIRAGRIVEFRKRLPPDLVCDVQGESVGFFRFSADVAAALARRCDEYCAAGRRDEPYEEVIRDLALAQPAVFGWEDITGLPWIEIDFPGDVVRARTEILPRLTPQDSMPA